MIVKTKSNLPYIIIGVVILVIIIVLLIGCILFKRHNRDKGVSTCQFPKGPLLDVLAKAFS